MDLRVDFGRGDFELIMRGAGDDCDLEAFALESERLERASGASELQATLRWAAS